jgi:hypothetical protein
MIVYMVISVFVIAYLSAQTSQAQLVDSVLSAKNSNPKAIRSGEASRPCAQTTVPDSVPETVTTAAIRPENEEFPEPKDNLLYFSMLERSAIKSARHQRKFLARKDLVSATFDRKVRFRSDLDVYAAIVISPVFAFLHIWKCGGSSVVKMSPNNFQVSLSDPGVQERKWVGTVRDPIDRFLSAWAECGFRLMGEKLEGDEEKKMDPPTVVTWIHGEYDFRVRAFLNEVKQFTFPEPRLSCHTHAHPQANSMMNSHGRIDSHIKMVGDLSELTTVLEIAEFTEYDGDATDRIAANNSIKSGLFPARRQDLKDETLLELCEYYALDYYLFDFDPPEICVQPGGPLARNL